MQMRPFGLWLACALLLLSPGCVDFEKLLDDTQDVQEPSPSDTAPPPPEEAEQDAAPPPSDEPAPPSDTTCPLSLPENYLTLLPEAFEQASACMWEVNAGTPHTGNFELFWANVRERCPADSRCGNCLHDAAFCQLRQCTTACTDRESEACERCTRNVCNPDLYTCLNLVRPCLAVGEPCASTASDTAGFLCDLESSTCQRACTPNLARGSRRESCPRGQGCFPRSEDNPSELPGAICRPSDCSSPLDSSCPGGGRCETGGNFSAYCGPAGDLAEGETCIESDECQAGLICIDRTCHRLCDPDSNGAECTSGTSCLELEFARTASESVGFCATPCPAHSRDTCDGTAACTPVLDELADPLVWFCADRPSDAPGEGQPCVDTVGCAEGLRCLNHGSTLDPAWLCSAFCTQSEVRPCDTVPGPDGSPQPASCVPFRFAADLGQCREVCTPFPTEEVSRTCANADASCIPYRVIPAPDTPVSGYCWREGTLELGDVCGEEGDPASCKGTALCVAEADGTAGSTCAELCDPFSRDACGEGRVCSAQWFSFNYWDTSYCMVQTVTGVAPGEPCPGGEENSLAACGDHAFCFDLFLDEPVTCHEFCTTDAHCSGAATCQFQGSISSGSPMGVCRLGT